jgi:hypothetical protein
MLTSDQILVMGINFVSDVMVEMRYQYKEGFVASDFHLVQEPRIFNCFHQFLFHLIQLDSMYHFQVQKMTHMCKNNVIGTKRDYMYVYS